MSIDRSLRTRRNVLSRAERVVILQDLGHWSPESSALGLVKIAHRKARTAAKKKKTPGEGEAAATTGEAAAPADKPAKAAKPG
jgi:small basic protein (TIGR04137 family)